MFSIFVVLEDLEFKQNFEKNKHKNQLISLKWIVHPNMENLILKNVGNQIGDVTLAID